MVLGIQIFQAKGGYSQPCSPASVSINRGSLSTIPRRRRQRCRPRQPGSLELHVERTRPHRGRGQPLRWCRPSPFSLLVAAKGMGLRKEPRGWGFLQTMSKYYRSSSINRIQCKKEVARACWSQTWNWRQQTHTLGVKPIGLTNAKC